MSSEAEERPDVEEMARESGLDLEQAGRYLELQHAMGEPALPLNRDTLIAVARGWDLETLQEMLAAAETSAREEGLLE